MDAYRQALDGFERSLGRDHEYTKGCARGLAIVYFQGAPSKEKLRKLVSDYPNLLQEGGGFGDYVKNFIR